MTTIEELDDSGFTTDACPHPPRGEKPEIVVEELENTEEKSHLTTTRTSPPRTFNKKRPKQSKPKTTTSPIANIINIANCNGVHIGKSISYNIHKSPTRFEEKQRHFEKTEAINRILKSTLQVSTDHIMYVSSHVGEGWKDVGRLLDYSDGQIYQFEETHIIRGVKEVVYQMLLDWIQNEPEKATVSRLTNALWDSKQEEVVQRFAKKFCV
ncbi:imd [Trypoxylus dichotomus]